MWAQETHSAQILLLKQIYKCIFHMHYIFIYICLYMYIHTYVCTCTYVY